MKREIGEDKRRMETGGRINIILKINNMVNREIIRRKMEKLESNLTRLDFIFKRSGDLDEYLAVTAEMKQLVDEVKSYIEYEPRTGNELNTSI
jgi:hypothetical protein